MTVYSKELKDDSIKTKIIMGYHGDNKSSYELSREFGISPRAIQMFISKQTHQSWWLENEDTVDNYFNGFGAGGESNQIHIGTNFSLDEPEAVNSLRVTDAYGANIEFKFDKPEVYKKDSGAEDNSRVLVISDLHFPYQHKDVFKFLQYLKDKYNPTRIICMGDEMDGHALSFHDSDPDLPSAGDELRKALPFVQQLYKMFPKMDILDSNHGSLVYRKAKHHGVPKHYIKGYNEVLGVDDGWKWSFDLTIDLPNGTKCYFHHGKSPDVVKLSQVMGMSAVQGHYHSVFKVDYWANPTGLYFGMQTACLVDRDAYAFAYENCNLKKPIIGTGLIIDSHPVLEPLIMDELGNWIPPK